MSTLQEKLARLRRFNASVRQSDPALAEESTDLAQQESLESALPPEVMDDAVADATVDPLAGEVEGVDAGPPAPLRLLEQIRFV